MHPLLLAAGAAFACGVMVESIGVALLVRRIARTRRMQTAQGVVVATELYRSPAGVVDRDLHRPTIHFATAQGRMVEHTPAHYSNLANYAVGQTLAVQYDPARPDDVLLGDVRSVRYWIPPFVAIMAGGVMMVAAAVLWFVGSAVPM